MCAVCRVCVALARGHHCSHATSRHTSSAASRARTIRIPSEGGMDVLECRRTIEGSDMMEQHKTMGHAIGKRSPCLTNSMIGVRR